MFAFAAIAMILAMPASAMEGSVISAGTTKATISVGVQTQIAASVASLDSDATVVSTTHGTHGNASASSTQQAQTTGGVDSIIRTQLEGMDAQIQDGSLIIACESDLAKLHTMGDVNMDGVINMTDLDIMSAHYNMTSSVESTDGDLNSDGSVNFTDLLKLAQNYGKRLCTLPAGTACVASLRADINDDGITNMADLQILTPQYNTSGTGLSADFTADGQVNFADLLILAQEYGKIQCSIGGPTTPTDTGTTTTPTTTTPTTTTSGNAPQTSTGGTSGGVGGGEVLGTSFSGVCGKYLDGFVMKNRSNKLDDVVKVQLFLRQKEDAASVVVNGVYDTATRSAVDAFQTKYTSEVLQPWADAGLLSPVAPTTNVYLTTQRMINKIMCPALVLPMPTLVPASF